MPLANYTSETPVAKSIADIEAMLFSNGATSVNKQARNGRITALVFSIPVNGTPINILLPANVDNAYKILRKERQASRSRALTQAAEQATYEQAERTAWRILWDWTRIQLSLIRMGQVELIEVFLPYVVIDLDGTTFFKRIKDRGYAGLLEAPKEAP